MSDKKLSPTEYELLTKSIYEGLIHAEGVDNISVIHNKKLVGHSGAKHQVDVYWEHKVAGKTYKTLIECKHYRKNVCIGRIRDFYGVLQDVGATGIFVTKVGFQNGATKFALYYGIDTKLVRKVEEDDLKGRIRSVQINITAKYISSNPPMKITNITFIKQDDIKWLNEMGIKNLGELINPYAPIYKLDGTAENIILGELLNSKAPTLDRVAGGPYTEILKFSGECVEYRGRFIQLGEITIEYHVSEMSQTTISEDALDIYTHILKDHVSGDLQYLKHRDGGGKRG